MKEKIKIFLQHNWFKIGLLVVIVIVVSGAFYWFQWRPSQIKKECYNIAREKAIKNDNLPDGKFKKDTYDAYYKWCLEQKGL